MTGSPEKVSVIIPVYNVEKYLSTCLTSCINQTLYDIEILCVNDGSTDSSLDKLETFAMMDERIRVINKTNGGPSSARNVGIKAANGKIIMFLDSDDYLEINACERVWIETLETAADIVVFGANIFPHKPRPEKWLSDVLNIQTHCSYDFSPNTMFEEKGIIPFHWRQAYNKRFLDNSNVMFDERVKFGEDTTFQMEIFPHARKVAFIEDKLYNYRWYREDSAMSGMRGKLDEKIETHFRFVKLISKYWESQGWLEEYGEKYLGWLLEFFIPLICNKEVNRKTEHILRLNALIAEFNLDKHLKSVNSTYRRLLNNKL